MLSPEQMMAVVARYADASNVTGASGLEQVADRSRKLEGACQQVGRDPAVIRRSAQHFWDGRDRQHLVENVARYFELGFSEQVIGLSGPEPARAAMAAAEALPELRSAPVR